MKNIQINKETKQLIVDMSKVNMRRFEKLDDSDKIAYALTFLGKRKTIHIDKPVPSIDSLSHNKNRFLNLFENQFKLSEQKLHQNKKYFGIEIECILPLEKLNIDYYNYSSASSTCCDCDGSGILTYVHRGSGNEIEHECGNCDGSGEYDYDNDTESIEDQIFDDVKIKINKIIKSKKIKGVNLKLDGSISYNEEKHIGVEFTIVVPQDDFSNLNSLCSMLNDLDVEVNTSCGLHVHLDMRDKSKNEAMAIGEKMYQYINRLFELTPKSRHESTYCKKSWSTNDRYHALNMTAYDKYSTIECRLHSGTTNYDKIKNWCLILKGLVESEVVLTRQATKKQFLSIFANNEKLVEYINQRFEKFANNSIEETELEEVA